jgi:hypothetical protein
VGAARALAAAPVVALALALAAAPAAAQQSRSGAAAAIEQRPLDLRPPPADFSPPPGAPRLAAPAPDAGCAPSWPCRLRLFGGVTGKYGGGIGLKAPALSW